MGGALAMCEACQRSRGRAERGERLETRRFDAGIPLRYQGFRLRVAIQPGPGEGEQAFIQRLRGRRGVLGLTPQNAHALNSLRQWPRLPLPRPWLWLRGGQGRGKTLLLSALGEELLEAGQQVVYLTERGFFGQLLAERQRSEGEDGTLQRAMRCDVLLLDDVNADVYLGEKPLPWMVRGMLKLVDGRYSGDRPIIFASRTHLLEYAERWQTSDGGEGVAGRLLEMCGHEEVALGGADWRMSLPNARSG